jgi:ribonuclease R
MNRKRARTSAHIRKSNSREKKGRHTVEGTISITRRGTGYVSVPGQTNDVEISPDNLGVALDKDTVRVRIERTRPRPAGVVTAVIERAHAQLVGTLQKEKERVLLRPDNRRIHRLLSIIDPPEDAKPGMKAFVRLKQWSDPKENPEGVLIEIIGPAGLHETEMRAVVLEHGFRTSFPQEVEREAAEIKRNARLFTQQKTEGRRDMRQDTTFTIDPEDAKDFDDALSYKKISETEIEVGIHIADVSHWVEPGSALDKEARKRGTSVYLVDRTIPMLPEALSNDVCSLNPNEDKLTYSAVFKLSPNGNVHSRWFGKTIIHSDKRFTYETAQHVLNEGKGPFHEELKALGEVARKLRERRFKKGSIDFDQNEYRFILDESGRPIEIKKKERLETNELIEDFMLLANQEVATYFKELEKKSKRAQESFIYRIHETPDPSKIEELAIFVRALGYEFKAPGGEVTAQELNRLFKQIEGTPEENLIKTSVLRTMAKAVYSTKNIGHFGLSFPYYTHFTSPIRRYPDIMVHRILKSHLDNEELEKQYINAYQRIAAESSRREMEAVEAERDSIKLKQVEYMSERVGEEFKGIITGVVEWGLYIQEKETGAEGLARIASLGKDYYEYDAKQYRLKGVKTNVRYTLGDTVSVRLVSADLEERMIEWKLM